MNRRIKEIPESNIVEEEVKLKADEITEKFDIAPFERKIYSNHFADIKSALASGKILDRTVTVYKDNGKFTVLDGQHRLLAARDLLRENKLGSVKFVLRIIDAKDRNEAMQYYFDLNKGKPLNNQDRMKALDDGTYEFFGWLRDICSHYGSEGKFSFARALQMIHYGGSGLRAETGKIPKILELIRNMEKWNIERFRTFFKAFRLYEPNLKSYMWRTAPVNSMFRVYWERFDDFTERKLEKFIEKCRNDPFIRSNANLWGDEATRIMYEHVCKLADGV